MYEEKTIKIKCIKVEQPIGDFYIGKIHHDELIKISYVDMRRLIEGRDREIDTFMGIQRRLSSGRVKELQKYVNLVDSSFPTSVLLAIDSKYIMNYKENLQELTIAYKEEVAKVLDGQHRIEGLKNFSQTDRKFDVNITIFVDMDIEDQAMIFATINKTQTKVNKSLVADLYEYTKTRSPQKSAHDIVRALDRKAGSPFYKKIKILGHSENRATETITQATFVENLLKYISEDPMVDRDKIKRGFKLEEVKGEELRKFFFRNLFIQNKDANIAKIVWNYFDAVRKRWPDAWNIVKTNNILNKSTGFIALMRFLKDAYLSFSRIGEEIDANEFFTIFEKIDLNEEDFNVDTNYKLGEGGQSQLYKDLLEKSGLKNK